MELPSLFSTRTLHPICKIKLFKFNYCQFYLLLMRIIVKFGKFMNPSVFLFFLYSVFLSRMQMAARQDFCALNPLEFMRHVEMHLTLPLVDRIQVFESQNKPGQELPENRALESICHQGSWPGRLMAAGLICFWLFRYSLLFMHSHWHLFEWKKKTLGYQMWDPQVSDSYLIAPFFFFFGLLPTHFLFYAWCYTILSNS